MAEYFNLKEIEGLTVVDDEKIKITPIENDFERYRSYRNVELSRYGTIEIRSDCTQNVKNIFNVVAFNVGISANLDEAYNKLNEKNIGALIYLFEKSCAMSVYLLGVNPFNQPGVEVYKKNMFKLLGKPGY